MPVGQVGQSRVSGQGRGQGGPGEERRPWGGGQRAPRDVLHVGQDTHGEEEEGGVPRDMEGVEEGIVGQVERWQDVGLGGEQEGDSEPDHELEGVPGEEPEEEKVAHPGPKPCQDKEGEERLGPNVGEQEEVGAP